MSIEIRCRKDNHTYFPYGDGWYYYPVVDGKEYSHIAENEDVAMLIGLGIKYDGLNSQFAKHASRMLGIDTEWAN